MRPAEQLEGLKLSGGWTVVEVISKKPTATGGNFSTGYLVQNDDGREGYLKAMDYSMAMESPNTPEMLKVMTEAYLFEKRICEACRDSHLHRVVHAIDSGSIMPDPNNPYAKVEYLIFERAGGDVRAHLSAQKDLDIAFALRVLHNIAVGLEQMHNAGMAHQDLKPSNVLVFDAARGSKISDLGRAWSKEMASPHDVLSVAGDWGYAPPEQLYRAAPDDPVARRYGCDLYHFGSMICFMFSQVHMNAYLMKHLAHGHRANVWGGSYDDVLPYVKAAFSNALNELETHIPDSLRLELIEMVRHLCEPDPAGRGDPQNRQGPFVRFSLNRYISRFDHLSRKAELHLRRK